MDGAFFREGSFYPIKEEFSSVELGDKRLGKRLNQVARNLSRSVGETINHAFATWGDTKAAYRFFSNPHVEAGQIQTVHVERTKQRMRDSQSPYLLVVEDKSTLNFSKHPRTKNLGAIGHKAHKPTTPVSGIMFHQAMVYTPKGVALGLLNQSFWVRPGYGKLTAQRSGQYYKIDRTQKESFRFVEPVLFCKELQQEVGVPLIVVSDREGDINEFLEEAITGHVGFVVRAHQRRLCVETEGYVIDYLEKKSKPQARIKLKVLRRKVLTGKQTKGVKPRRSAGEWRTAHLDVYWGEVTLPLRVQADAKSKRQERLAKRKLTAIWVKERPSPGRRKFEPIDWLLFTALPVETREDALEVIKIYQKRWLIEIYHRILKSGCKVEDCRLAEKDRLVRYLHVMGVVAWRIQALTQLARDKETSRVDASICLEKSEVEALRLKYNLQKKVALSESLILIARLGGFLARKGDKDPGPKALWSGMQRLIFIAEGVALAQKENKLVGNR